MSAHGRTSLAGGRAPQPSYSFPVLHIPEILSCLQDLMITNLKTTDLTEPKGEVVVKIYEHLVEHCMQKSKEELTQPHFAALDAIKWNALHEESIPRANFFQSCRYLCAVAGVSDFSLADIGSKPDQHRFQRNLSAILNFAKFREEKVEELEQLKEEEEIIQQELEASIAKRDEVAAQLARVKAQREAELPAIRKAEEEVERLRVELGERNKAQAILRHETAEDKAEIHALKDALAAKAVTLAEVRQAAEKEQSLIVQSPERIKQELAHLSSQLAEEEESLQDTEAQKRDMRGRLDRLTKLDGGVDKLTALLTETCREWEGRKRAAKAVKELQERIDAHKDTMVELEAQKKSLERSLQRVGEKLSDFRPAAEMKTMAVKKAISAAKADYDRVSKENAALGEAKTVATSRKDAILQKRDEERRRHKEVIEEMTSAYARLQDKVTGYHGRLRTAMAQATF